MSFRASMLITADAKQAKAELRATKKEADGVTKSSRQMGAAGRSAGSGLSAMERSAAQAATNVDRLSRAEQAAARDALQVGRTHEVAAGSVGNLVGQFNDVGVMMMAGQNPLQLAVQQGLQITQVIGPMGAAGAMKALKTAAISLLSPINFITLGSLAFGAALIQAFSGGAEKAQKFEKVLEEAEGAIDSFSAKADRAKLSTSEMFAEFGTADPVLKAVLADMAALGKLDAYEAIDKTSDAVRKLVLSRSWASSKLSARSDAQRFLGLGNMKSSAREAGAIFAYNLSLLSETEDQATKLQAALDVRQQLLEATGGVEGLNAAQRKFYNGLTAIIRDLTLMGVKVREAEAAQNGLTQAQIRGYQVMAQTRTLANEQSASALALLSDLQEEVALKTAILQFGAESAQVAELRAAAERENFVAQLDQLGVAQSVKDEILAQYDAAGALGVEIDQNAALAQTLGSSINGITFSAPIQGAIQLSKLLNVTIHQAMQMMGLLGAAQAAKADAARVGDAAFDPRSQHYDAAAARTARIKELMENPELIKFPKVKAGGGRKSRRKAKGSRSAASAIDREREALDRLFEREQERLELIRETDPVEKEMIRNRDALKSATEAERDAVRRIIAERHREKEALEGVRERTEALQEAIDTVLLRKGSLSDMLADMLYKGAAWGQGPLGSLFGGQGLFGMIFPGLKFAEGGYLTGAGGPRQDKMPIWGSAGEFMVNAAATSRYRHLLEHINSGGDLRGFASGGALASAAQVSRHASPASASGVFGTLRILLDPRLKAEMLENSGQLTVEMLENFERNVLPASVQRIQDDPRAVG